MKRESGRRAGKSGEIFAQLLKNKAAVVAGIIFFLIILMSIFADYIAPQDYAKQSLLYTFAPSSPEHLLGTDNYGRDVFSRIVHGSRYSLSIGLFSVLIAAVGGVIFGSICGYYGGLVDTLLMRFLDIYQGIPSMMMMIVFAAVLGSGITNTIIAIGISTIPSFARMTRASILTVRTNEYVEAARVINARDKRIIFRHILPNALSPILVNMTMQLASNITMAAGLSFIGLGVQPPLPEWGALLNDGRAYMRDYPLLCIYPGACIMVTVLTVNILGDGLRDAFDPRLKD